MTFVGVVERTPSGQWQAAVYRLQPNGKRSRRAVWRCAYSTSDAARDAAECVSDTKNAGR